MHGSDLLRFLPPESQPWVSSSDLHALDRSHAFNVDLPAWPDFNHGTLLDTIPLYPLQALAFIKQQ
jgi:hypothetical protein